MHYNVHYFTVNYCLILLQYTTGKRGEKMSTRTYKCPNCGAYIEYKATKDKFECDYCGSPFTLEEVKAHALDSQADTNSEDLQERKEDATDQQFREQTYAYFCEQCGAKIITDENTASTFCLYCHSPNIIKERISDSYAPQLIIPFKIEKEDAIQKFISMASKKLFTPKDFGSKEQQQKISGLYVPYWLFDERSHFDIDAHGYRVSSWRQGDIEYTKTDTYAIRRTGYMDFEKVPIDASKRLDNDIMDRIEPYDYTEFKDFEMEYLSGYYTDKYDEDQQTVYPHIKEKIQKNASSITEGLLSGYARHKTLRKDTQIENLGVAYALLPIWFLTYRYKDKDYPFTMNGQTGKIYGNIPRDNKRAWKFFGILSVILYVIIFIGLVVNPS